MEASRLINLVLSDLSLKNIILQDKLEKSINLNLEASEKLIEVENNLEKLAINELMMAKFQSMVNTTNNNENQIND